MEVLTINTKLHHEVKFKIEENFESGVTGLNMYFPNGQTFGEPSWDTNMFLHDIFEHSFEFTKFFNTPQFAIEGESFAMGIRYWFYVNTIIGEKYINGRVRNYLDSCLSTITSLVSQDFECRKEEGRPAIYTHAGSFETCLPSIDENWEEWHTFIPKDSDNLFAWEDEETIQQMKEEFKSYEKAFNYGYQFAGIYYEDYRTQNAILDILENLKYTIELLNNDPLDPYEMPVGLEDTEITVHINGFNISCEMVFNNPDGENGISVVTFSDETEGWEIEEELKTLGLFIIG